MSAVLLDQIPSRLLKSVDTDSPRELADFRHRYIVEHAHNLFNPTGYMPRESRRWLDARVNRFIEVVECQFPPDEATARREAVLSDIADALPNERLLAKVFTRNCIMLAREILDLSEIYTPYGGLSTDAARYAHDNIRYKALVLDAKQSAAQNGAIITNLGRLVPHAEIILPALGRAAPYIERA